MGTLQQKIITELNSHGWSSPNEVESMASVSKFIENCCGGGHATVYCYKAGDDQGYSLRADYQSEGRNVLGSMWLQIPGEADDQSIADMVAAFIRTAERKISETFGVRILKALREGAIEEAASLALAL